MLPAQSEVICKKMRYTLPAKRVFSFYYRMFKCVLLFMLQHPLLAAYVFINSLKVKYSVYLKLLDYCF